MVLVGASMGGLLVLAAARGHAPPAMVLVNPVPPAGTPGWPPAGAEFPDVVPWNARQTVAQTLARLPDHASDLALADTASWRDESGAVMSALYDGVVVPAPTTPTLIMSGSADKDVPPDTARHLAGLWGVDAAFFAGVSHLGALLGARAKAMAGVACSWLEAAGS